MKKYIELKGIPEDVSPNFYLGLKDGKIQFLNRNEKTTSFGIIPNFLLNRMLKAINPENQDEETEVSHLRLKVGRQDELNGFGARHILSVEDHICFIHAYISAKITSTNECNSLVRFLDQLNLNKIESIDSFSYAVALEQNFQRFVLALETVKLGLYHHILIVLFPDGFDFTIGTIYPIAERLFQKIKKGDERYIPIDNSLPKKALSSSLIVPCIPNLNEKIKNSDQLVKQNVTTIVNNNNTVSSDHDIKLDTQKEKTYEKVSKKLKSKKLTSNTSGKEYIYLTKLEALVEAKMVNMSDYYFILKIQKPNYQERKTYSSFRKFSLEVEHVKMDILNGQKNYNKMIILYNNAQSELKKYIDIKNLTSEFNCKRLIISLQIFGQVALGFDHEVTLLLRKGNRVLIPYKEAINNYLQVVNVGKTFGALQDCFSDIFSYSVNKDENYWKNVTEKLLLNMDEIGNSPKVHEELKNTISKFTANILYPLYIIIRHEFSIVDKGIKDLIALKKEIGLSIDLMNIDILKVGHQLLKIFIARNGRGLLRNESLCNFLGIVIYQNKDAMNRSCVANNQTTLFKEFMESFGIYQSILLKNNIVVTLGNELPSSLPAR